MFLRGEACVGGDDWLSLSLLLDAFRDSHEKGLVSFRVGAGGWVTGGGGEAIAAIDGPEVFEGDSVWGDQGMEGRASVMLCRDIFLSGWSLATEFGGSMGA